MEALRRGASHVVAVDPAPRMLNLVEQRLEKAGQGDRCTLVLGSFPDVPLDACDQAIVMGVMDYVERPEAFLSRLRGLVRRSAAVSFPSKHFIRTPARKLRYYLRNCPVYFYDEPQICRLCAAAGFGQVTVHKIPGAGMDYHVCVRP
jgi:ubiquinone/menaquinone biosynthesis C-methylase UbiE